MTISGEPLTGHTAHLGASCTGVVSPGSGGGEMPDAVSDVGFGWEGDDKPGEECGVFGIYAPGQQISHLTHMGLHAIQHRGQESAGLAIRTDHQILVIKEEGLVADAIPMDQIVGIEGDAAIGHVRYSTTGASGFGNAQPMWKGCGEFSFAVAHNGNLTNTEKILESLPVLPGMIDSDTDTLAEAISAEFGPEGAAPDDFIGALKTVLPAVEGAFSLVFLTPDAVIAARDPKGYRPLCLGRLDDGYVVASETVALETVGAVFVREIEPGEIISISDRGVESDRFVDNEDLDRRLCVFEFVYFARIDSVIEGSTVLEAREEMGRQLAREHPVLDADVVIGVPDSGLPAAMGYAAENGTPFRQGLMKNRYSHRSFIAPDQNVRDLVVRMKLSPVRSLVDGKSLVVVDDSIVRGTTTKRMVEMLRNVGAKAVHLRIASPPYRHPCFFGIDTGDPGQLLAARVPRSELAAYLGADSVEYLSIEGLLDTTGIDGHCDACLTGKYPRAQAVELETSRQRWRAGKLASAAEAGASEGAGAASESVPVFEPELFPGFSGARSTGSAVGGSIAGASAINGLAVNATPAGGAEGDPAAATGRGSEAAPVTAKVIALTHDKSDGVKGSVSPEDLVGAASRNRTR